VNATLATPYQRIGFWEKRRSKAAIRHLISIPHLKSLSKISVSQTRAYSKRAFESTFHVVFRKSDFACDYI
jgi:hypothetical protein